MQTQKHANAFPIPDSLHSGLTKLEYFAAQAIQGLLSRSTLEYENDQALAEDAVKIAQELIRALRADL